MRALGGALLLFAIAGCDAAVESGLEESQANEAVVALDARGVSAAKEREEGSGDVAHFRVTVSRDDVPRALSVLREAELPRRAQPGLADVFGEGGLVPTATEERAKYTAALGGELARSLESIDGVLSARVHVALPDAHDLPLDGPAPRPRASVLIKYSGTRPPYEEPQVRALVAGAVDGMEPEDVAVVGVPAARATVAAPSLVRVGPIATTPGSAGTLKLVLAAAFGTNVVLVAGLVAVVLRRRRAPPAAEAAAPTA